MKLPNAWVPGTRAAPWASPGAGTVSAAGGVQNDGLVEPGRSAGILRMTGPYAQSTSGRLAVEIGGRTVGSGYDRLQVSGAAQLNGPLSVALTGGFVPLPGDAFAVLTCGSRTGQFASATGLDDLGGHAGLDFQLAYGTHAVALVATAHSGDANVDAAVNVLDLGLLASNYKTGGGKTWLEGDFTGEGVVNILDLGLLAANYRWAEAGGGSAGLAAGGSSALAASGEDPVPEPAALALLALGGAGLIRRHRR